VPAANARRNADRLFTIVNERVSRFRAQLKERVVSTAHAR